MASSARIGRSGRPGEAPAQASRGTTCRRNQPHPDGSTDWGPPNLHMSGPSAAAAAAAAGRAAAGEAAATAPRIPEEPRAAAAPAPL
eukprot:3062770-Alexandrium_andersonii.AAC.1